MASNTWTCQYLDYQDYVEKQSCYWANYWWVTDINSMCHLGTRQTACRSISKRNPDEGPEHWQSNFIHCMGTGTNWRTSTGEVFPPLTNARSQYSAVYFWNAKDAVLKNFTVSSRHRIVIKSKSFDLIMGGSMLTGHSKNSVLITE